MLGRLFAQESRSISSVPWEMSNGGWGPWSGDSPTTFGQHVSVDLSMQLLCVYGCSTFITDEIATLPAEVLDAEEPSWVEEPTPDLDRIAWLGQIMMSLLMHGNSYLWVQSVGRGSFFFVPLDPNMVRPTRIKGVKRFLINGAPATFDILHIPGRMLPGSDVGMSPVTYARHAISLGLSALRYGVESFDGDLNMPGVIEIPKVASPERKLDTARLWQRRRKSGGRGLPGVLDDGATWKASGVSGKDAQFLETRKFTDAQIAGQMFLMDPSDLGIPVEGSNLTYANLGQRNTRRVQVTMMPWIRRIETAMSRYLLEGGRYHLNVDARLRGDTRESYETLAIALAAGFMTIDEVREILNMPPRPNQTEAPTARELAEMIQKIYLGVDVVLTAEEARDILNSGGANLVTGPFNPKPAAPAPQFAATNGGAP
jgi:HK97 family phage portal protein